MAEAFVVLPYDWDEGAKAEAVRHRIDPVIRDIWLRLEDAGFRSTDIKPVDLPGSFAGRPATKNWIIQVDKPGTVWSDWDLFRDEDDIQKALEGLEFPAGSVFVTTDDSGRESRRQLVGSEGPQRKLP